MESQAVLQGLRRELRRLRRRGQRWSRTRLRVMHASLNMMLQTVLVFALSDDPNLAIWWAHRGLRRHWRSDRGIPERVTVQTLHIWRQQHATNIHLIAALRDLNHTLRFEVDCFLIESLVMEDLRRANAKGVHVPTAVVVEWYVRKWSYRPQSPKSEALVDRLTRDGSYVRQWGRYFRRRWQLDWGSADSPHGLSNEKVVRRCSIYLRWAAWLLREKLPGRANVVVNMDETAVGNVKEDKSGNVVNQRERKGLDNTTNGRPRGLARCTLIASISDDPDVQAVLPQILLPRCPPEKMPSRRVSETITAAGYPIEAWYGSTGFMSQNIMKHWLTRVSRRIRSHRRDAVVVVIMDTCSVHVSEAVLKHACRLKIAILLVPARLTWLLQPLDTHVFAQLKQKMRRGLVMGRIAAESGALDAATTLRVCTQAVRETLVERDWTSVMQRAGVSSRTTELRLPLATLLESADLEPRPPTDEELQEVVNCSAQRATLLRRWLVQPWETADIAGGARPHAVEVHAPLESQDVEDTLRPLLRRQQQVAVASSGTAASADLLAESTRGFPRGRRLFPCTRNLVIPPLPAAADEARVATRSQRRPLLEGVCTQPPARRPRRQGTEESDSAPRPSE
jgi:hypothetical protein